MPVPTLANMCFHCPLLCHTGHLLREGRTKRFMFHSSSVLRSLKVPNTRLSSTDCRQEELGLVLSTVVSSHHGTECRVWSCSIYVAPDGSQLSGDGLRSPGNARTLCPFYLSTGCGGTLELEWK